MRRIRSSDHDFLSRRLPLPSHSGFLEIQILAFTNPCKTLQFRLVLPFEMSPPAMVKMEDAKFLLDRVLSEVLAAAKSCMPTDDRFKVVKEDMKRRLKNTNMKPLSHSSYLRLQVLCQIFYDANEKLHVLDELSISDLKSFIPELCSQVHYTNVPIFDIGYCCQFVKLKFLTLSSSRLYIEGLCHGNLLRGRSNYPLYFQVEQEAGIESIRLKALIDLFDEIVEPLFNQLRQKSLCFNHKQVHVYIAELHQLICGRNDIQQLMR
ncbi:unnamed protein product [Malus baccata var. baccata]